MIEAKTGAGRVQQAQQALATTLAVWMPLSQRQTLQDMLRGEEKEHFADVILKFVDRIDTMPVTYQQDGKGEETMFHLHYFRGGVDAWISEKDMDGGVNQAFGKVAMHGNTFKESEFGYISIVEVVSAGLELDLYFEPKSAKELSE